MINISDSKVLTLQIIMLRKNNWQFQIQGKALLEIEKKYIDIYVAKNLQVEYFYKFLSLFLISLISKT